MEAATASNHLEGAGPGEIGTVFAAGVQAPAVLLVAFIPMFFIAAAFYYMNRADPD